MAPSDIDSDPRGAVAACADVFPGAIFLSDAAAKLYRAKMAEMALAIFAPRSWVNTPELVRLVLQERADGISPQIGPGARRACAPLLGNSVFCVLMARHGRGSAA